MGALLRVCEEKKGGWKLFGGQEEGVQWAAVTLWGG